MTNQNDIELYNLVHELRMLVPNASAARPERRRRPRKPFDAVHRIAPLRGERAPTDGDFQPVRCRDLNQGGFSFLLPQRPDFVQFVAALGDGRDQIRVLAEVAHWSEVLVWPSGKVTPAEGNAGGGRRSDDPQLMFQVGCRFLRRLP